MYKYGMKLRGLFIDCQLMSGLMRGLIWREDDPTGRYHDVLVYDRQLTEQEMKNYELDYLGEVSK